MVHWRPPNLTGRSLVLRLLVDGGVISTYTEKASMRSERRTV
jgi:hypothetical protein